LSAEQLDALREECKLVRAELHAVICYCEAQAVRMEYLADGNCDAANRYLPIVEAVYENLPEWAVKPTTLEQANAATAGVLGQQG
jgi:hypothetical protein